MDEFRVGPKGYVHGWHFVGAPGIGAHVFHPGHGHGTVTAHSGKHATVKFNSGAEHSFEARPGAGPSRLKLNQAPKPLAEYAHPESVQHDGAFQEAMHAEDLDAAVAALKRLDKTEAKAGVKPGEGVRLKIAGEIQRVQSIKRDKQSQYKELGKRRETQAGQIATAAGQVITQGNTFTKTTPEQAGQVKTSLSSAAERVRNGDYEGALKDLTAAREAAQGPGGTQVMTSGADGRGAVYRIDDLIKDVQRLAADERALAKYAPTPKAPRGTDPAGEDRASDLKYGPGSALWKYWTKGGGAAKWAGAVHKWRTLRDLLLKAGVPPHMADGLTTNIITAVMPGYMKQAHKKGRSAVDAADGEDRAECVRSVPFELTGGGDGLTLEGYAAVFNRTARITDRHGEFDEQIAPGAFADSLARKTPVLMFEHGKHPLIGSMPLGRIDDIHEDKRGLFISARLSDNWLIQPVRDAVKDGAVTGMSFRFASPSDGDQRWEKRDGKPDLRTLLRLDAPELGPVVFPAYEPTTASVRSLLERLPDDFTGRDGARSAPGGDQQDDVQPGNGETSPTRPAALRDRAWRMRRQPNG